MPASRADVTKALTDLFYAPIDFEGQKLVDTGLLVVWLVGGAATLALAWQMNSQEVAWRGVGVLTLVSSALFVPSWRCFRRHPVTWHGEEPRMESDEDDAASGGDAGKAKAGAEGSKRKGD